MISMKYKIVKLSEIIKNGCKLSAKEYIENEENNMGKIIKEKQIGEYLLELISADTYNTHDRVVIYDTRDNQRNIKAILPVDWKHNTMETWYLAVKIIKLLEKEEIE